MGYLEDRRQWKQFGKPKVPKPQYTIPKKSEKKLKEEAEEKLLRGDGDTELQKWFKARMKQMGDRCLWCGCKVENKVYNHAIFSICHLLDKRETVAPSVRTHPLNWVTLCPDHHTMFDKMNWEEREQLGFWDIIRDRLIMVYPDLDPSERRHFPESVLAYMRKHDVFSE